MRVYLKLTPNQQRVPYTYQEALTGVLHKWLGRDNTHHDEVSLYSMSWLNGGSGAAKSLSFREGAEWFIGAHDADFVKRLVGGIIDDPEVAYGMRVRDVVLRDIPEFQTETRFFLASPILVKRKIGEKKEKHYTLHDDETDALMTATLQYKLRRAGLDADGVTVRFDRDYIGAKTKLCHYKEGKNMTNLCPVIVSGSPEQVGFAWCVGIGNSTGIGYGALV